MGRDHSHLYRKYEKKFCLEQTNSSYNILTLMNKGKEEEVVTIFARDAYKSQEGWLFLAAGMCPRTYVHSFCVFHRLIIIPLHN